MLGFIEDKGRSALRRLLDEHAIIVLPCAARTERTVCHNVEGFATLWPLPWRRYFKRQVRKAGWTVLQEGDTPRSTLYACNRCNANPDWMAKYKVYLFEQRLRQEWGLVP